MRGFTSFSLMAVLFLTGCATPTKTQYAHSAVRNIAVAKANISVARKVGGARVESALCMAEKSLESAILDVKRLRNAEEQAQKLKESTDFWRNKHSLAVGKLNFWRCLFLGVSAIVFAIGFITFSVSRIKPFTIL